jgi:F-type H+-transporting ATPase subunit delta
MKDIVVEKYAKAFFDVAYEKGAAGEFAQQIAEISKAFAPDVVAFFKNPFNSTENKLAVAKSAIEGKCSVEVYNFICTLVEKNRVGALHEISKELATMVLSAAGITKGKLFSAIEVSPEFLKQVEAQASKALNKKVELSFEKDATLIAGYKVQVGGWTLDDSAEAHLRILKDELMKKGL